MKMTVDYSVFEGRFRDCNRLDNFPKGLRNLFDYLEELEQDCGTEIELDVIALCCDFSENSIENALEETGMESLDELRDNTTVIEVDDETIIYQGF